MASESALEKLVSLLEAHIGAENGDLGEIKNCQNEHGELLARIDERTKQHEKRMDRAEKKAAGLGAVTGALGGIFAVLGKSIWPGS